MRKLLGLGLVLAGTLPLAAHAQAAASGGFDVEAATRGYLNLLSGPARAKSDAYFEGGYWLILWNALAAVAAYWLLLATGWSARMRDWAERVTKRRWLVPALYALPFAVLETVLLLPWTIYTEFIREAQYGLMNQTFGAWALDGVKALAISVGVQALVFVALFAGIRRFRRTWWAVGAAGMVALVAVAALVTPVFIAPLFNTYTDMPAGDLRDRIVAVAKANDIPAEHIYVSDASRQSKRISANVSGLGPTIRITLNDNLLNRTGPDEVVAVMGHEMGHYKLGHVWKLIGGFALIFGLLFFVASRVAPWLIARHPNWGVRDIADPAAAPILFGLISAATIVLTPLQNSLIRWNESEADAFGLDAAREPDGFAKTAIRLSEYRKLEPGALEEIVFFDHPSGRTRIRMAMQWKKDHVPNATMVKPELVPAP